MNDRRVRNVPVQTALEAWAAHKEAQTFSNVLRQCVAGELLLDITHSEFADPAAGFQPGDTLALGRQTDVDGNDLLVAFTSNERLSAYRRGGEFRSLAQPAWSVLAEAMTRAEGLALDPGDDALLIAYSDELRGQVTNDPGRNAALKNALVDGDLPRAAFLDLVNAAPVVYVGLERETKLAPAALGNTGEQLHPVFTSPAEVFAWSPALAAQSTSLAAVARFVQSGDYAGFVIDPAGPSAELQPHEVDAEG